MRGVAKRSLSGPDEMEFRILGPLEVVADGRPLPLGGASQRALLALLLLHANEVVSSDRLIDELWAGEPPASGVTALQVRVSQLRKALGADGERLETRPPGYRAAGRAGRARPRPLRAARRGGRRRRAAASPRSSCARRSRSGAARRSPTSPTSVRAGGDRAARGAAAGGARAADRRRPRARAPRRARRRARGARRGAPAARAAARAADARAVPLGPAGRGARGLPGDARRARRGARDRAEPGAAGARAGDPAAGPRARARAGRLERSILVASATTAEMLDALLALAEPLARRPPKELILARLVGAAEELGAAAAAAQRTPRGAARRGVVGARGRLRLAVPGRRHRPLRGRAGRRPRARRRLGRAVARPALAELARERPCDVAVLVGERVSRRAGAGAVRRRRARLGRGRARRPGSAGALERPLLLAGPARVASGRDASRLLANASLAVQRTLGVAAEPLLVEPGAGRPARGRCRRCARRRRPHAIAGRRRVSARCAARWRPARAPPVVLVRRGLRPGGLAPRESRTRFTWSIRA